MPPPKNYSPHLLPTSIKTEKHKNQPVQLTKMGQNQNFMDKKVMVEKS